MTKDELRRVGAKMELARRNFFDYAELMAGDFYKRDRTFLVDLCNELEDFYYSKDDLLVVNIPPRHGKSRTAGLFTQWLLGRHPDEKIMTGSYNETLSTVFSKSVRNAIQEEKASPNEIVYSDIFPYSRIKDGDGAMNLWSLEGQYSNYLATSPTGTATGFGASLIIIDDLIKNSYEANNEATLDKHWEWFTNTMLSRLEEGGKIIVIMTRWATKDLAGRVLNHYKEQGKNIRHVNFKAYNEDTGEMLCEEVLSKESFMNRVEMMGEDIVSANYQQEPIDLKGQLYKDLKTYDLLPEDIEGIYNYTDTADTGADYLCSINYAVKDNQAYILDIIFTREPMEVTEPLVAKALYDDDVSLAYIESNNGGRGFARQVERHLRDTYSSRRTKIEWFHQSQNKEARILSNATRVQENILFPSGWEIKYRDFYSHITAYQREGKNKHDDGADVLTGIIEKMEEENKGRLRTLPKNLLF